MSPLWILLTLVPVLGGAERFNCRGRILGAYYADAKSGCKAFHVCVKVAGGGIRDFRFFCPPGTLFHQEAQTCTDWGDDDPLACPAEIYDGQFDLYKIGSGYDTKKSTSSGNRDEENEYGLQRAETGDRPLAQNNVNNGPASDLRAAHSSDFFSGQRERGRDDFTPNVPAAPSSPPRQSFRRPTTPRTPPPTVQSTTSSLPPQASNVPQYDYASKRKLVRKRPVYTSTQAPPSTFAQNTPNQQNQQRFPEQKIHSQQNFDRRPLQNKQSFTSPPANIPPQYKDEYVEVSRVTPKQNKYFNQPSLAPLSQTTPAPRSSKKGDFGELYNYDAQSTPGLNNVQNENRPFRVRNSFNVSPDVPRESDYLRTNHNPSSNTGRFTPTTSDYNNAASKSFATSTQAYKNVNSVSYEPEKNNFISFSKQNHYNNPTTTPTTTIYTTVRSDLPSNFNTVAYNTNIGFNAQQTNYAENDEDDGQYRPPAGEDDGQYRPELYERELLSGAHSLNIAASGNRLPEDQKPRGKTLPADKPLSQTIAPRPFRPAPTPTPSVPQTTRAPEPTYTTTAKPRTVTQTVNTQRTFDYFQSYTTTARPNEPSAQGRPSHSFVPVNSENTQPSNPTTTTVPKVPETKYQPRAPAPPTTAPFHKSSTRPLHFTNPINKKEDNSYDYAYYDSDPGFTEYDHIEEFGKTKKS